MKRRIFVVLIVAFFVCLLSLIAYFYKSYTDEKELNSVKIFFDYQIKQLHKNIEDQKLSSMALAVLLGQNDRVQECFDKEREICIKNINEIVKNLSQVLMYKNIKIHIHTSDLRSYLRHWSPQNYGDNLSSFRYLLLEADRQKRAVTGIESGVGGTFIRAVANVTKGDLKLGTIEVMLDFNHVSGFFRDQGVDLFVLLDKKLIHAQQKRETDNLLPKYYVANFASANLNLLPILKEFDLDSNDFFRYKTHFFALSPLIDANQKRIGYFVLHVNKNIKEQNILQEYLLLNSLF